MPDLTSRASRKQILAAVVILTMVGSARPALAAAITFPPTDFTILNPDTGATIGQGRYNIESAANGAILHGASHYSDGQSDVETAKLVDRGGSLPKLVEFDHTFYNSDGSIQERAHADLRSGASTCTHTTNGVRS